MDWRRSDDSAERFSAYLDEIAGVMGHAARVAPMRDYCSGLLLDCERKSAEPIAAATAPNATSAKHQSLLHFLAKGEWSDAKVLGKVRDLVLPQIERHGPIEAWIIDDTSFPKCGSHSVGVSHQYCGQLGKQANCQVAVSLSVANHAASLPVAYRLYLPESWAKDDERRRKAGVPDEVAFQTKPKIALQQIEWACAAGIARGVVETDCAYGSDLSLRRRITALELTYAVGVWARTLVCKVDKAGRRGARHNGRSRQESVEAGVAHDRLARRHQCAARLALRPRAGARRRRGHDRRGARGVADRRMAEGREGAREILALHAAPGHVLRAHDRHHHDALAHRARLPGAQAGGRARPFRRAKLARVPSSRDHVHRRLWIPSRRKRRFSPLGASHRISPRKTCPFPRLPTQRLPRSGLSAMSRTPSQRSDAASMSASSRSCRAALAAPDPCKPGLDAGTRDAVRLVEQPRDRSGLRYLSDLRQ